MAPVTVKGEGGAVFDMDVPDEGTVQRELFDDALAKGRLTLVDDPDGLLDGPDPDGEAKDSDGGSGEGEPPSEPSADGPPAKSAKKADWVAWAISQGADPEEAEAANKDDLVDAYGGEG